MKPEALFPIIGEEENLPYYVKHIGMSQEQCHILRENGYPMPQIIYGAAGEGLLKAGGRSYEIKPATCFFLPKGLPHEYTPVGGEWRTNWIAFGGRNIDAALETLNLTGAVVVELGDSSRFDAVFKKIFRALRGDKLFGGFAASVHVYELLIELCRARKELCSPIQYRKSNNLMPVLEYIDKNLEKQMTLEELAAIIGVTPQHLCRVFKECLDARPVEYILRLRIQAAKKYLIDNKTPIAEVARQVGFNNTSYFCLVFKRSEGMTPTEFRDLNRR